jgi:serine/threonine protein kinase
MTGSSSGSDAGTRDDELLADLFDALLQEILDGRTPDLGAVLPERPDLRDRVAKTWQLACSVAGRREPSRPVLGGYEIVRELGHGGMGTVYLARHQTLQRDVAIKVLPHSLAMSPRAKQRFVAEARALAQVRHTHVVHIHRIIDHAEMLAFEMEFIDGPSLQSLIGDLRVQPRPQAITSLADVMRVEVARLGARTTVEWFVQLGICIGRALGEVHRHGLVHRDVKPANILLRKDGTPVLADFGLALPGDLEGAPGKFAGTPVYAAPERLRGSTDRIDVRTDIYSLGVTLYEALTANPPFRGTTTDEVLRDIESGRSTPLRQRAPHVSRDLATVVAKAMEPDPRRRYASADEFADDLQRLLDLQPIRAIAPGPLRRVWQFVRRQQKAFSAGAAGALLVGAIAWPLAAHAAAKEDGITLATAARHEGRSLLLSPAVLPATLSLRPHSHTTRRATTLAQRTMALQQALTHYDSAWRAAPDLPGLAAEREVVRGLASTTDPEDGAAVALPPLCRVLLGGSGRKETQSHETLAAAPPGDRFAAGLMLFLRGDHRNASRCWDQLPAPYGEDPLLDACHALALADGGAESSAYPQLFHAASSFPRARSLALGLADAAIAAGDTQLARRWIASLPPQDDGEDAARRELLAADLLAADGELEAAATRYRALSSADATDPTPLLRLARLNLRQGHREGSRRLLESLLHRWPDFAPARLQLARLALQRRDTATYLGHARVAAGALQLPSAPHAADLAAILHLGGLDALLPPDAATPRREDGIPLGAWLRRDQIRGILQVLQILVAYDDATATASRGDPRPAGVVLRAVHGTLLQLPRLTWRLPAWLQAGALLGIPACLGTPTDRLGQWLLPFQRVLGTRLHELPDRRILSVPVATDGVLHGLQVLRVGDLDGDTLDELCFACPPAGRATGIGFVELRNAADAALVRTWSHPDPDGMFARAIATLGDVDGDFCHDLLVGIPVGRMGSTARGAVELWSGRTGERLWRSERDQASFGAAVSALGDIDGDGILDAVVGAPPLRLEELGTAHVLSGRTGTPLHQLTAERPGTWFAAAVTSAGDVTGDGIDDIAIGGNFGRAEGMVVIHDGRDGTRVSQYADSDPATQFGASLLTAGDLDGDGIDDLAIAAPGDSGRHRAAGRVVVLSGRSGRAIYELRGERAGDGFGAVLCRLTDWRGNGMAAIAVGSFAGGPVGNGYVRVFDLATGQPLQTFAGNSNHLRFGYSLVDLGPRHADGLVNLGVVALHRQGQAQLWALSFADAYPDTTVPARRPPGR